MSKNEYDLTSEEVVEYIINKKATIRQTATYFGCSKTLIWSRIKNYNGALKDKVDNILNENKKSTCKNLKNIKG